MYECSDGISKFWRQGIRTVSLTGNHCRFQSSASAVLKTGSLHRTCFRGYASRSKGIFSYSNIDYLVHVKTGDQIHAGTDANVYIILHSENGDQSQPIRLDYFFRNDFERGQLDEFQLKNIAHLEDIHKIEIWRDGRGLASDWFLDYIEIESVASRKRFLFPVFRWIKPERRYVIRHMDNCLPQLDPEPEHRTEELNMKKEQYNLTMKVPGGPAQVGCTHTFVLHKYTCLIANARIYKKVPSQRIRG